MPEEKSSLEDAHSSTLLYGGMIMKCKVKRKIAVLAVLAVVFQAVLGYFPNNFSAQLGEDITPDIVTTYAAPGDEETAPGGPTQGPTSG